MIPFNIVKKYMTRKEVVEVGRGVTFEVVRESTTFPNMYWYRMEAVYKIWVRSPELDDVCRRLAGPGYKPPGGFNIVVGVRKIKKRDQMIKNKSKPIKKKQ